jgi:hypothetical protein
MRGCWLRVEDCRVSLTFDPFDLFVVPTAPPFFPRSLRTLCLCGELFLLPAEKRGDRDFRGQGWRDESGLAACLHPCRGARFWGFGDRWCHPLSRVQPPATGFDASGIGLMGEVPSSKCQVQFFGSLALGLGVQDAPPTVWSGTLQLRFMVPPSAICHPSSAVPFRVLSGLGVELLVRGAGGEACRACGFSLQRGIAVALGRGRGQETGPDDVRFQHLQDRLHP